MAAATRIPLGADTKLYYNSGSYGSPTWVLITRAIDVMLTLEAADADITSNVSTWELFAHGIKRCGIDFSHFWKTDETAFMALYDAFWSETPIEILCLDGAYTVAGKKGVRAMMLPMKAPRNQTTKEKVKTEISLKLTDSDNAPEKYTVSA